MVLGQIRICRDRRGSECNTTFIVQKRGSFQARAIKRMGRPRILIEFFRFYIQFFTLYELYIRLLRYILSNQSQPGTIFQKKEMELMQNL